MPSDRYGPPAPTGTALVTADTVKAIAVRLLALVQELLLEIRPSERTATALTLDSHVDRDLGLDSLARTELLRRIEQAFHVQLGERVLLAETPRDLVELILRASGQPADAMLAADWRAPMAEPSAAGAPDRAETLPEVLDWHVETHPERTAIQIYGSDERIDTAFTYAALRQGARAVATGLRERGLQPGQTVAIMLPTGADYFLSLELKHSGAFQYLAVLLNDYATGIRNGKREFGQIIVVRCIDSVDARKATARELPWKTLHRLTRRITAIPGVNRCLYDLTPKPPATVEYI